MHQQWPSVSSLDEGLLGCSLRLVLCPVLRLHDLPAKQRHCLAQALGPVAPRAVRVARADVRLVRWKKPGELRVGRVRLR